MEVLVTLAYVFGGVAFVMLLGWLAGAARSRKIRPSHLEHGSPLDGARRRYLAGEISRRELQAAQRGLPRH